MGRFESFHCILLLVSSLKFLSFYNPSGDHIFIRFQNSEYPRIFQVTGANQNARKFLSTDLVNTKFDYSTVDFRFPCLEVLFTIGCPVVSSYD